MIDHLILDFDGTLTDMGAKEKPYRREYAKAFSEGTGLPYDEVVAQERIIVEEIKNDPAMSWIREGHPSAPACAELTLRTDQTYKMLLERVVSGEIKIDHDPSLLPDDPKSFFYALFKDVFYSLDEVFRPDVDLFLDTVANSLQGVAVVTNSGTEIINQKLGIQGIYDIEIVGGAQKDFVYPDFEDVPNTVRPKGFPQDVHLRRKDYHRILTQLESRGFTPERTAVVGDVFEFDIALPHYLGYFGIQIETPFTPEHTRLYYQNNQRCEMVKGLDGVLDVLGLKN